MADTSIGTDLQRRLFGLSNRILAVEKKVNNFARQLQIIEEDMIDKHRSTLKQVKDATDRMEVANQKVAELEDYVERLEQRMKEFATREKVKVLEKYINVWSPIDFVTRKEVTEMISKK